ARSHAINQLASNIRPYRKGYAGRDHTAAPGPCGSVVEDEGDFQDDLVGCDPAVLHVYFLVLDPCALDVAQGVSCAFDADIDGILEAFGRCRGDFGDACYGHGLLPGCPARSGTGARGDCSVTPGESPAQKSPARGIKPAAVRFHL